jgi:hypothetical protein
MRRATPVIVAGWVGHAFGRLSSSRYAETAWARSRFLGGNDAISVTLRDSHVVVGQRTVRDFALDEYVCAAGYSGDAGVRHLTMSSALHTSVRHLIAARGQRPEFLTATPYAWSA